MGGCIAVRYVLVMLCHAAYCILYLQRVSLSVAIMVMVRTVVQWNESKQGLLLGSYFVGYVLTQIPGSVIAK